MAINRRILSPLRLPIPPRGLAARSSIVQKAARLRVCALLCCDGVLEWAVHRNLTMSDADRFCGRLGRCDEFFRLGGVFASAMTGNLALLAFYVSRSETRGAVWTSSAEHSRSEDFQPALRAIAMGVLARLREVKIQSAVVVSYLFGALLSGAFLVRKLDLAFVVPFAGVALSLPLHYCSSGQS